MIKNIITSAITALVVVIAVIGLVGGDSTKLGGTTNYDAIGVDCIQLNKGTDALYMATTSTGTAVWISGTCN